jgi:uncharacterized protein YndB with AHSA1/START domain
MRWIAARTINAPADRVFRTVADPEEFHRAIPDGVSVVYLTAARSGVGTKFRATRMNRGKPAAFDQEVIEYVPDKHIRMHNETHGTLWIGMFDVTAQSAQSVLTLTMDSKTDRWLPRIMTRLIAPMVQKALEKDMDAVKAYCER